jgi:hypothetical protein
MSFAAILLLNSMSSDSVQAGNSLIAVVDHSCLPIMWLPHGVLSGGNVS